ncbi:MAG: hypothetical protein HY556_02885 [Euryarchaeota archaeon]|nr:hypothetical protein [Euryarchaeota archaeon]
MNEDDKRNVRFLVVLFMPLLFASTAWADQVHSQASVKNKGPHVVGIDFADADDDEGTPGIQISPVPGGSRTFSLMAHAQDDNGWQDISGMSLKFKRPDGSQVGGDVSGADRGHQGRSRDFAASFTLQHYDPPGTYELEAEVSDGAGDKESLIVVVTVQQLLAFSLDASSISFTAGSLDPGSSTHSGPSTVGIINKGNVKIDLQVSATDMAAQGFDASIPAGRIKYSNAADMAGEVGLASAPSTDASFDLLPGSGAVRSAYFDIHVPTGDEQFVPAATYTGSISIGAVVSQ